MIHYLNCGNGSIFNTAKNIYTIDLKKWNITNGFLEEREYIIDPNGDGTTYLPKYTDEEYLIAHNNKVGLQNALNYATENGYNYAVLPKNSEIFVCWEEPKQSVAYWDYSNTQIIIPNHLIFDMNNSTIKIIFDSFNKNPYDNSVHSDTNPIFYLHGNLFTFRSVDNSGIVNGKIMGCRYERAFINTNERKIDFGNGIFITEGGSRAIIDNMDISGFMADGISGMTSHDNSDGKSIYDPVFAFAGRIDNTGVLIDCVGAFTTDYLDISEWNTTEAIIRTNMGYTRVPNTHNQCVNIAYYDIDKNYILSAKERYLQTILIPYNASFVRITAIMEPDETVEGFQKGFQFTPISPEFLTISNCNIYNNHRGGISNVVNNTIVERCKIYNNGLGSYEGVPQFTDSTRYGINCEDCLPLNLIVRDNYFHNHFHAILFAGGNITVDNNMFYKCGGAVLNIYNCENAHFVNNTVINGGNISSTKTSLYDRSLFIENNKFINSGISINATNLNVQEHNNTYKGICNHDIKADTILSSNIIFDVSKFNNYDYVGSSFNASNIRSARVNINDSFISTASFDFICNDHSSDIVLSKVTSKDVPIYSSYITESTINNCDMRSRYSSITDGENTISTHTATYRNSIFNNSRLLNVAYDNNDTQYDYNINNVAFNIDNLTTLITFVCYSNQYNKILNFNFKNCKFNINSETFTTIFDLGNNRITKGTTNFENCEFNNNTSNNVYLFNGQLASNSDFTVNITSCKFNGQFTNTNADESLIKINVN